MITHKVQVEAIHPKIPSETIPFAADRIAKPPISTAKASCASTRDDVSK
jgi:hypothetical protein